MSLFPSCSTGITSTHRRGGSTSAGGRRTGGGRLRPFLLPVGEGGSRSETDEGRPVQSAYAVARAGVTASADPKHPTLALSPCRSLRSRRLKLSPNGRGFVIRLPSPGGRRWPEGPDEGRPVQSAYAVAQAGITAGADPKHPALTLSPCRSLRSRRLKLSPNGRGTRYRPIVFARSRMASSMRQGSARASSLVKRTTVQPRASIASWRI